MADEGLSDDLRQAGVPDWLIDAFGRLARGVPTSLDGLLVCVGDEVLLDDTRATCRTHFVVKDGNGRPRVEHLAKALADRAVDYCIPRSRIEAALDYVKTTGSTAQITSLSAEATALFTKLEKSGEGGELLLYTLLETVLKIPQVLCKMPLKTSTQMHVHGTDGVHAKLLTDGGMAVYWGESKLHKTVNSAVDDCFESVAPYLLDEGGGAATRDLLLVRDHLDAGAKEITAALLRYFAEGTAESAKVEYRAACLVGFDIDDYPTPHDATGQIVVEEVRAAIETWYKRVGQRIAHHSLGSFEIEVFCVPVPSVDDLRAALRKRLKLT